MHFPPAALRPSLLYYLSYRQGSYINKKTHNVLISVILRRDLPIIVVVDKREVLHTVSVCVDLGIQHAMRMRLIVICGLPRSTIFFHIPLNVKIF